MVAAGGSTFDKLSDVWLKGRIGEGREVARGGAVLERVEDLSASFALGGNGVNGDGVCGGLLGAPMPANG